MDVVGKIEHHEKQISFTWTINDFCDVRKQYVPGQAVLSPTFYTDIKCKWQLKLWPQGTEDDSEFVSLGVYYLSKPTVKAAISFSVIDDRTTDNTLETDCYKLFEEGKGWGEPDFFYADEVCKSVLTVGNKLIIKCKIELDRNSCLKTQRNEKEIDLRIKEYEEFEELLSNNKFSDVILSVGEEDIHAHKCILATKSAVFAAMFENDEADKECNIVEIEDVSPDILKEMLRFIYTGKVKNIREFAMELLIVAEKYLLTNLKRMCEETLYHDLSPSNAIRYLKFAESHNASNLKAQAIQYIVSNVLRYSIDYDTFLLCLRHSIDCDIILLLS